MKATFPLKTRIVDQLAGVAPGTAARSYQRNGHFRGIVPRKGPRGLLWPSRETYQALGLMPPDADVTVSEQLALRVLTARGVPTTPDVYATVCALLSAGDPPADADALADETWLVSELADYLRQRIIASGVAPDSMARMASDSLLGLAGEIAAHVAGEDAK